MSSNVMAVVAVVIGCIAGFWLTRQIPYDGAFQVFLVAGVCVVLMRLVLVIVPKLRRK